MNTNMFDYTLPSNLIADHPSKQRGDDKLLVLDRSSGALDDTKFSDIINLIKPNDLIIMNDSKVMKARLYGEKTTGGKLEFLIERVLGDDFFYTHIRANHAPKQGATIIICNHHAIIESKKDGLYYVRLQEGNIWDIMDISGHIPLPPYIKREDTKIDEERYQTVYGDSLGSVAAPTAGLHFTHELIDDLKKKQVEFAYITLHVGSGTFKPVQVEDVSKHAMHTEIIHVSSEVCKKIKNIKKNGGRIIAVGTTSVRSLETAAKSGEIRPYRGETDIFLYPGRKFNIVDAMITNFHLPKSTLIMLVSAFSKTEYILKAYNHAITNNYKFFSYGDAMFIH